MCLYYFFTVRTIFSCIVIGGAGEVAIERGGLAGIGTRRHPPLASPGWSTTSSLFLPSFVRKLRLARPLQLSVSHRSHGHSLLFSYTPTRTRLASRFCCT